MRFRLLIPALVVAAALPAAPAAARASTTTTALALRSCQTGDDQSDREGVFYSRMHAVPGTHRMAMRFTLIDRSDGSAAQLSLPSLARWRTSNAGVASFGYSQRITDLEPGHSYSVAVDYRWFDARGHRIKSLRRSSPECRQDGHLPNLTVTRVAGRRGDASGTESYLVDVTNSGAAEVGGIRLDLFVDGAASGGAEIDSLAPGETVRERIPGPACRSRVRAVVDRLDAIPESREDDNALRMRCPPLGR
jgi:hypothetical protein